MTPIDWLVILVVLIVGAGAALAVILSNAAVTRSINHLERSYRRQKTLELEQLQAQLMANRDGELREILDDSDGSWRQVVQQLLADAFPERIATDTGSDGWLTLAEVSDRPPQFAVGRQDETGETFLFSASREALSGSPGLRDIIFNLLRRDPIIAVDASLSPTARVEVEAVWRHLAQTRSLDPLALPRKAEWYLTVRTPRGR